MAMTKIKSTRCESKEIENNKKEQQEMKCLKSKEHRRYFQENCLNNKLPEKTSL